MSITLRTLLAQTALNLRVLIDPLHAPSDAPPQMPSRGTVSGLDATIEWVHNSDLKDPTPFLTSGTVLLTTGAQFTGNSPDEYRRYVAALVARGVRGLGFGTDVSSGEVPPHLVAACSERGFPLFEVPYKTPFIAIVKRAADLINTDKHARDSWSLGAQRAVAMAALQNDGLAASLHELSRQLGNWVALYDIAGNPMHIFPDSALTAALADDVTGEVSKLLAAGNRSSASNTRHTGRVSLQTLGSTGQLRGVLAVGGDSAPDAAALTVITSVVALASLSLEQRHALGLAGRHLRTGTLRSLLDGNLETASHISDLLWGGLPETPLTIIACDLPIATERIILDGLNSIASHTAGSIFYADLDENLIILCSTAGFTTAVRYLLEKSVSLGSSHPGDLSDLGTLISQARQSLTHALDGTEAEHITFCELADQGVWSLIDRGPARLVADALLEPLRENDRHTGGQLEQTAQRWLFHNGQWAVTAADLSIHRHTLKHRIELIEHLLSRDLSSFNARAELWAALQYASQPTDPPPGH
ncbi:PucR family transcriptional regulator ligand-binding domain-containing protein [Lysinibacter sp. HNR]|uniref:PucR family transcriptional regulator n=1 Tax=Lysinibacter sp. HNR TaxID=3031408 RepID=UPI002436139F|nr:PucR family transcriptional regulator ligand-binding domain-containing protein [Lysinibacter sp. HNR]WGD38396.1 PucR family transcriptional regulator ligand-binding domain-containing protein [Lysinibacter sp. HNR]